MLSLHGLSSYGEREVPQPPNSPQQAYGQSSFRRLVAPMLRAVGTNEGGRLAYNTRDCDIGGRKLSIETRGLTDRCIPRALYLLLDADAETSAGILIGNVGGTAISGAVLADGAGEANGPHSRRCTESKSNARESILVFHSDASR